MPEKILFYATAWCSDCRRAKKFFDDHGIAYQTVDVDQDPAASDYVRQVNHGNRSVPTIVFPDRTILVEPSNAQLADKLGIKEAVT